jgi:hypothetical protein
MRAIEKAMRMASVFIETTACEFQCQHKRNCGSSDFVALYFHRVRFSGKILKANKNRSTSGPENTGAITFALEKTPGQALY